jgi:predicted GNAT family N-acyltransferase
MKNFKKMKLASINTRKRDNSSAELESSTPYSKLSFHRVTWAQSSNETLSIRHKVFIIERHFDENVLCDLEDKDCIHLIARNEEGRVIACARLNRNGRISRIAVLIPYRGEGIGTRVLRELVAIGKQNKIKCVSLNAEIDNKHLYDQQSFSAVGSVYMKQGIPHQMLACKLG